jgi:hypothetical protein
VYLPCIQRAARPAAMAAVARENVSRTLTANGSGTD